MTNQRKRTVLITGGTGGIGLHSAIGIAKTGAKVLITGRDTARGQAAQNTVQEASGNSDIGFLQGDLSSSKGIDQLAKAVSARIHTLDVLVNNAGYLGDTLCQSSDSLEMHFAVNVFAPWRLTHQILPILRNSPKARVINVSGGDKPARIDPDNLQAEKGFKGLMTYTHSKSVLEAMTVLLSKELEPDGIPVNVVFPGRASTNMTRSFSSKALPGPMKLMYPFFRVFFREDGGKSAARAAQSTIWAATATDLDGVTGAYFDTHSKMQKMHDTAYHPEIHRQIHELLNRAL